MIALVCLLAAFVLASAALAGTTMVGYVDYATLLQKAPQARASRQALQKLFKGKRKAIKDKMAALRKIREQLAEQGPGDNSFRAAALAEQYRKAGTALRKAEQQYRTELRLRTSQAQANFYALVGKVARTYARSHGMKTVVDQGVGYAGEGVDITGVILARLKRAYVQTEAGKRKHK